MTKADPEVEDVPPKNYEMQQPKNPTENDLERRWTFSREKRTKRVIYCRSLRLDDYKVAPCTFRSTH